MSYLQGMIAGAGFIILVALAFWIKNKIRNKLNEKEKLPELPELPKENTNENKSAEEVAEVFNNEEQKN